MPLLTVAIMKFFLRGQPLNRRFWFATGMLLTMAIVLSWGVPALVRTKGEFFRVGIGRHVVERSFGAMEGHGSQTLSSYFITLPFYFVTVFDGIDRYLITGTAIIFILMTVVKTKLPHYTLTAFPLLSLLLARHLFALPGSPRFAVRAAVGATVVMLGMALIGFPLVARTFPTVQLFEKSERDLSPEMHFGAVDYAEPSLVWYFRSRVRGFYWALKPEHVEKFMAFSGPRFVIMPTAVVPTIYPELPAGWKSYTAQGFNFAKGQRADLTMILKPMQ
jgi:hypothetical protein